MLKTVLAIVGGIVAAFAIVLLSETLLHATVPASGPIVDMTGQPTSTLGALAAGWTVAALAGSWIAARLSGRGAWPGWVVGGLFLASTAANFLMIPHPLWLITLSPALIVGAVWLGSAAGARPRRRTA